MSMWKVLLNDCILCSRIVFGVGIMQATFFTTYQTLADFFEQRTKKHTHNQTPKFVTCFRIILLQIDIFIVNLCCAYVLSSDLFTNRIFSWVVVPNRTHNLLFHCFTLTKIDEIWCRQIARKIYVQENTYVLFIHIFTCYCVSYILAHLVLRSCKSNISIHSVYRNTFYIL